MVRGSEAGDCGFSTTLVNFYRCTLLVLLRQDGLNSLCRDVCQSCWVLASHAACSMHARYFCMVCCLCAACRAGLGSLFSGRHGSREGLPFCPPDCRSSKRYGCFAPRLLPFVSALCAILLVHPACLHMFLGGCPVYACVPCQVL